ncbi:MAG TPA: hypothetical protein VGF48_24440 [Thermoanaerobaculia bacterium]|jgi:hypothetical protein
MSGEEKPDANHGVPGANNGVPGANNGLPDANNGLPPIGGSWRNLYIAVIGTLVVLVILFYVFTRAFA